MRGLPSFLGVFGGSAHFSASLPLLALVKNVSLVNPYLDPACAGGGFTLLIFPNTSRAHARTISLVVARERLE